MKGALGFYASIICVIIITGSILWLTVDSNNPSSVFAKAKAVNTASHTQSSTDDDALVKSIQDRALPRITFSAVTLTEGTVYDLGNASAMGIVATDADGGACPIQVVRVQYKDFSQGNWTDWKTLYYGLKVKNDPKREEVHDIDPGALKAKRGAYRVGYRVYEEFRGTTKEALFTTVFPVD